MRQERRGEQRKVWKGQGEDALPVGFSPSSSLFCFFSCYSSLFFISSGPSSHHARPSIFLSSCLQSHSFLALPLPSTGASVGARFHQWHSQENNINRKAHKASTKTQRNSNRRRRKKKKKDVFCRFSFVTCFALFLSTLFFFFDLRSVLSLPPRYRLHPLLLLASRSPRLFLHHRLLLLCIFLFLASRAQRSPHVPFHPSLFLGRPRPCFHHSELTLHLPLLILIIRLPVMPGGAAG